MQNNQSKKASAKRAAQPQPSSIPTVRQPRPTNNKSPTVTSAISRVSKSSSSLVGSRPTNNLSRYHDPNEFPSVPTHDPRVHFLPSVPTHDPRIDFLPSAPTHVPKWEAKKKKKDLITAAVHSRFEHGSTGRKIYNHIKGAAAIAMQLAPHALKLAPLLLAAHPATQANAINAGDIKSVTDARAAFTLRGPVSYSGGLQNASPISYSNPFEGAGIIGMNNYVPLSKKGLVSGARIRGCDKVLDIPGYDITTNVQWSEGDLVLSLDLNPTGETFQGTALYQQVSVYNRYQVHNMVFMYVPNVPTTTSGGLIMSITPDPDSQYTGTGILGTQLAMAVDGADPFSVFQAGCVAWAGDKKQKFYARPDGTDPRFTSPGILNIVLNTQILPPTAATADYIAQIGSLYCMYDITVTERSLEDSNRIQSMVAITTSGAAVTPSLPYGTPAATPNGWDPTLSRGFANVTGVSYPWVSPLVNHPGGPDTGGPTGSLARSVVYSSVGGLGVISGLPVGFYSIAIHATGNTFTAATPTPVNTGQVFYSSLGGVTYSNATASSTATVGYTLLYVSKQCTDDEAYLRISFSATSLASCAMYISRILDADAYNAVAPSVLAITNLQNEVDEMREKMGLPTRAKADVNVFGRRRPRGHGKPITIPDVQPLSSLDDDDCKLVPSLETYQAVHPDRILPELGSLVPLDHVRGFSTITDPFWRMENKTQIGSLLSKGKLSTGELSAVVFSTTRKDDKYPYRVVVLPSSLVSTTDTHFVHSANYQAACRYMPIHASV